MSMMQKPPVEDFISFYKVNVYECLGMELQVGKYLEDVSHLLYECTCEKNPEPVFAFADAADTWHAHSKLNQQWSLHRHLFMVCI